ncbi:uncharacterized protein LOC122394439 [Amphibalanus amphitrite]|uniref:uncharacterized protein LOC122394439 n=1 Tax=Amphibalanus amphitrite TaxID=1232801 RepID=UPI001C8FF7F1|nr:uncharacterized protein LOC122394439 [Amphibalanus amphitrite]
MLCRAGWKSRLWLFQLLILPPLLASQAPPFPNLNLENLPDTSFSCEGKVVGGYYADIETKCQMFHVCTLGSKGETQDIKFLCLQGTVFDQETRVCERSEEVACTESVAFYDLNKELYQPNVKSHSEPKESSTVTDSDGEASVASVLYKVNSADSGSRTVTASTTSYAEQLPAAFADVGPTRRPTRTRLGVPLFSPRRTEPRTSPPPAASQPAFSRFRQDRLLWPPSSTPTPTASPSRRSAVSVPLIPTSDDLNRPRVVVTNGKPFVPQLSAPDPAPKKEPEEEDFPSLTLPETNFTCESKVSGGHYADPETDCRMFHICVMGPDKTITDYKFLCGSGTAFEQKSRTCQEIEKIDCSSSAKNYHVNNHLIVTTPAPEPTTFESTKTDSVYDYGDYYDYYFDYPEYGDYTSSSASNTHTQGASSTTYRSTF